MTTTASGSLERNAARGAWGEGGAEGAGGAGGGGGAGGAGGTGGGVGGGGGGGGGGRGGGGGGGGGAGGRGGGGGGRRWGPGRTGIRRANAGRQFGPPDAAAGALRLASTLPRPIPFPPGGGRA